MAEEEEDIGALHSRIFGSDDDSDEEDKEYEPEVPDKGRKRLQKGKASSSKKRRSAPDAEALAAEGVRLEAEAAERRREKGGEGGDDGDPDEDSVDGDEAIEEGSKKDMDRHFKKGKAGRKEYKREQLDEDVDAMIAKMEAAADRDDELLEQQEPAIEKAQMMPEVAAFMRKRHYHEVMVDRGFLAAAARWLKPMEGALVNLAVRTGLLKSLQVRARPLRRRRPAPSAPSPPPYLPSSLARSPPPLPSPPASTVAVSPSPDDPPPAAHRGG